MRLSEMRTEVTPQKINKVMESRFGFSIDYDNLTYAKAQRLRNALGENITAIKKSFGAHTAEKNAKYMELMLVKEGLDKWLNSEQGLFESEMGRSEAVLAAKDIVDSVQDMLEKISKIQNEQVPALIDTIRDQIGSEQAEQFKGAVSPMLVELYSALSTARESSDTAVRQLAGEDVGQSMDMNMGGGDAGLGGDSDFDDEDMFGAEPAAAGGAVGDLDEPELGRERRGMNEHFAFDTPKSKDRGTDELARRAKLGKNPLAKGSQHARDYKEKDRYGNMYKIGGPKGQLPEGEMDAEIVTTPQGNKFEWQYPENESTVTFAYPGGKITIYYDNTRRAFDLEEMWTDDGVARDVVWDHIRQHGKWLRKDEVAIGKLIDKIISMKKQGMGESEELDAEIVTTPQGNKFEWQYHDSESDVTFAYPGGKITIYYDNTARAFDLEEVWTDDGVARDVVESYMQQHGKWLEKDEVAIGKLIDQIISMKKQGMGESKKGGIPTTPKQKRFAALAKPTNRITQADRIAGATKSK